MKLNVEEKVLLHLYQLDKHRDQFVKPVGLMQDGVAEHLGKSRPHAAVTLRKLMDKGLVASGLNHIEGAKYQRRTYKLTPAGFDTADALVRMIGGPGEIEAAIRDGLPEEDTAATVAGLRDDIKNLRARADQLEARIARIEAQGARA